MVNIIALMMYSNPRVMLAGMWKLFYNVHKILHHYDVCCCVCVFIFIGTVARKDKCPTFMYHYVIKLNSCVKRKISACIKI